MQPFILKYAREQAYNNNHHAMFAYRYDTKLECNVFMSDNSSLSAHSNAFLIEYTGSTITRAMADPTNDEPTDR